MALRLGHMARPSRRASAHHCGLTVRGRDPKKQQVFPPNCGLFYCLSAPNAAAALNTCRRARVGVGGEDSNSINRNFNIYSLGGFPLIIYDDQRDVKGAHLAPL